MKTLLLIITTIAIAFTSHAGSKVPTTLVKMGGRDARIVACATPPPGPIEKPCETCPTNATVKTSGGPHKGPDSHCFCNAGYYSHDGRTCVYYNGNP